MMTIIDFVPRLTIDEQTVSTLCARYRGKIVIGHVGELDVGDFSGELGHRGGK